MCNSVKSQRASREAEDCKCPDSWFAATRLSKECHSKEIAQYMSKYVCKCTRMGINSISGRPTKVKVWETLILNS